MRVVVDYDLCESNALCMAAAPEVFEVRDDDFMYVLQENPPENLRAKVEEAVQRCPKQAHQDRGLSLSSLAIGSEDGTAVGHEPEHPPVERQFRLGHRDDGRRLAEAVLLSREGEVGDRDAPGSQGVVHELGLGRRDDGVLQALETG